MSEGDWTDRYSRQILLPGVGGDGQRRLMEVRVGVVGHTPLTLGLIEYLLRTGLGHLEWLVDEKKPLPSGFSDLLSGPITATHSTVHLNLLSDPLTVESLEIKIKPWDIVIDTTGTQDITNILGHSCRVHGKYFHACWVSDGYGWVLSVDPNTASSYPLLLPNMTPSAAPDLPWDVLISGLTAAVASGEIVSRFLGFGRKESLFLLQIDGKQGHYAGVFMARHSGVDQSFAVGNELEAHLGQDAPKAQANFIDITGETCPMTFVRVKLKLETLTIGSLLTVRLSGADTLENVRLSLENAGQRIVSRKLGEACEEWLVEKVV